jgi:hypothetical protein
MIKTMKVNVVGYIFPTERKCHRLRAHPGFRYITKFGTGVAFKIFPGSLSCIGDKRKAGADPLSLKRSLIFRLEFGWYHDAFVPCGRKLFLLWTLVC